MNQTGSNKRGWVIAGAGIALAIIAGVGSAAFTDDLNVRLANDASLIEEMNADIENIASVVKTDNDVAAGAVTGVTAARSMADRSAIENFLSRVVTWDDYDSYMRMRQEIMADYAISADSPFAQLLLPDIQEYPMYSDGSGDMINLIDHNGWNMSFGEIYPYVTKVDDTIDVISYFVILTVESEVDDQVSDTTDIAILCNVNAEGVISNVDAMKLVK